MSSANGRSSVTKSLSLLVPATAEVAPATATVAPDAETPLSGPLAVNEAMCTHFGAVAVQPTSELSHFFDA